MYYFYFVSFLQREAERQQRAIKMAVNLRMADEHRQKRLLMVAGFRPWVHFVRLMRSELTKAQHRYEVNLLRGVFVPWRKVVREREEERTKKAEEYCRGRRLRLVMNGWSQVCNTWYLQQFQFLCSICNNGNSCRGWLTK